MLGPIFQTFRKRLLIFRYRKVELMDLRSVFTTVICSFESFKKSNWSFSKCENYRGITLFPTAYKLFANIIKNRLNEQWENEMEEEQCGFRRGRSCIDAIFTVQQIIEKRKEHNLQLFLLFID
jgi:hypothetical protein